MYTSFWPEAACLCAEKRQARKREEGRGWWCGYSCSHGGGGDDDDARALDRYMGKRRWRRFRSLKYMLSCVRKGSTGDLFGVCMCPGWRRGYRVVGAHTGLLKRRGSHTTVLAGAARARGRLVKLCRTVLGLHVAQLLATVQRERSKRVVLVFRILLCCL